MKLPDDRRDEFHNADRLNDTWFKCIYSFNTLFKQFHLTLTRKADIYRYLCFALPHRRNCLRVTLSLINIPINKGKLCQEKSGRNQFWTDHFPVASTSFGELHTHQLWAFHVWQHSRSEKSAVFLPQCETAATSRPQSHTSVNHNKTVRWRWETGDQSNDEYEHMSCHFSFQAADWRCIRQRKRRFCTTCRAGEVTAISPKDRVEIYHTAYKWLIYILFAQCLVHL